MHHWIPLAPFQKIRAQAAVSEGRILMATAHSGNKQGYVELLDGQDVYEAFHEPHYIGRFCGYKEDRRNILKKFNNKTTNTRMTNSI